MAAVLSPAEDFDDPAGFVRGRPELDISALDEERPAEPASSGEAGSPGPGERPDDPEPPQ
jgi:hypothetical protein